MDRGINYALKDTLIQSSKDEQRLKVSWLPQYMYEACINKDFESIARLSCLCAFSTSFKNLQYVRIVLQCSKITSIDVYIIPFDEFNSYEIDQLYELEKDAVLNNRYYIKECCSSKIDRHTQLTISDLISQKMLRKNPDIYCWYSRYVKPLIDSLDIINLVEDTINFKMIYSPNGSYRNLCLVRSNTVNLYVYETRNHIIWDTISPYYMNFIEYKDIIDISKSYDLYLPPLLIGGGDFITNKLVLREFNEYNYLNNKFNLKNENLKTKRLKRNEHVKIFYRAEICDAKLSKYSFGIIVDNNK